MCTLVVKLMCDGQPSSDVLLLRTDTAFRYKRNIHLSLEPLGRAEREREGGRERVDNGGIQNVHKLILLACKCEFLN